MTYHDKLNSICVTPYHKKNYGHRIELTVSEIDFTDSLPVKIGDTLYYTGYWPKNLNHIPRSLVMRPYTQFTDWLFQPLAIVA